MSDDNIFYDGTKLLSLKDIDGKMPEIYMTTSNRSAGKTTFFSRYFVNRFLNHREKFCLLYRYNYELSQCEDKFFKDIKSLFFFGMDMTSETIANGKIKELFIDDRPCGYAVALNDADTVKKFSHFFSDVSRILFDEFQSETNKYCSNEIDKFMSIHTSIARGGGKQVRYVPVFMLSNPVTLLNPYYTAMHISERLQKDTKFLRGHGFVLEQNYNEIAGNAQLESGFNRAFLDSRYLEYASQNVYLNDNNTFIEKPSGKGRYICTIKSDSKNYSIWKFPEEGIIYCDNTFDASFPTKIALSTDDHAPNYIMLKQNEFLLSDFKYLFDRGCFRFKNLACKAVVMEMLSYK